MKRFEQWNNLLGWLVFAIATATYFLTLEPTASWWDCGEYIATAFKLQVGHPPGAPFFQIMGRFFSLFAFGDTSKVALMINAMSALSSSFTVLFLFWTITLLGRKLMPSEEQMSLGQRIALFGAGAVGALAFTFSDSFWFSAVEGEVYAMSSFFTALVFWAILRWERVADEPGSYRWLVLIAYIIGITVGVHLLNLLAVPAVAFVYYYRKYKPTYKGAFITLTVSFVLLAGILYGIIPWIVNLSGKFELFFVNSFGLPFNSGTLIYFALIIGLIVWGLRYTRRKGQVLANTAILSFLFILIGYSSFFMLIIRSNANTPIDENNPEDAIALLSYLNREQYGTYPIFYGHYHNAPLDPSEPYKDGSPIYIRDDASGRYVITDDRKGSIPNYDSRFESIFPRMWSNQKTIHVQEYERWGGKGGIPIQVTRGGNTEVLYKPTMAQNLRYFFTYQVGHMYFRYFMWNYAGRQNDVQGHGSPHEGNWISGIPFLDEARLGSMDAFPDTWKDNPARNTFFLLPLLLGIVGLFFHIKRHPHDAWVVALMFLMTGLAIIVYLNQYPYQPRERDYAYTGSFYTFAIWIGLGVLGLYEGLRKLAPSSLAASVAVVASLALVPGIMASEGWDDHDRSGKTTALDFAKVYLESCAPNAVLITNGDNDTFPLWYAQEVEGIRTDVRVVNFMLASGSWYVHQLATKVYDSPPLPFTLTPPQYERGTNDYVPFYEKQKLGRIELKDVINFIANDQEGTKVQLQNGKRINFLPTKQLRLTVDSAACVRSGLVPESLAGQIVPYIDWDIKKNHLFKNDLMLLDFLATFNWERPLYFASPSSMDRVFDVNQYCHMEGFVYRFMPVVAPNQIRGMGGLTDTQRNYELLVDRKDWGNLNRDDVTVDRESYRNAAIPRNSFMRLAQAFLREGNKEQAIATMDAVIDYFPNHKILYDVYMYAYVELYYEAEAPEKAREVGQVILDNLSAELRYIDSLPFKEQAPFSRDREQYLGVLGNMAQLAERNQQPEFKAQVDEVLAAHPRRG
jgi:hypothetical protein